MAELERYPFFGTILRALDQVLVAVDEGPQGRTEQVVEGARRIVAEGRPMVIYPEGTLMDLGAKERYRRGAGHIYTALGCKALPVAVSLGVIWPKRDWRKFTGVTGAIEFLPPIEPGLDLENFMAEVEDRIETGTMRLVREHAPPERVARAEGRQAEAATAEVRRAS
jgi:1-acyl-sn-glycerol-3-phosphate acyltransferase